MSIGVGSTSEHIDRLLAALATLPADDQPAHRQPTYNQKAVGAVS